jgi:hypothetical protein
MYKHSATTLNKAALFSLGQTMYYKKRKSNRVLLNIIERFFTLRSYAKNR